MYSLLQLDCLLTRPISQPPLSLIWVYRIPAYLCLCAFVSLSGNLLCVCVCFSSVNSIIVLHVLMLCLPAGNGMLCTSFSWSTWQMSRGSVLRLSCARRSVDQSLLACTCSLLVSASSLYVFCMMNASWKLLASSLCCVVVKSSTSSLLSLVLLGNIITQSGCMWASCGYVFASSVSAFCIPSVCCFSADCRSWLVLLMALCHSVMEAQLSWQTLFSSFVVQ